MALIDTIQQNLATAGAQPVQTQDETQKARGLLAAKSGKQVAPGQLAPQSAVGEAAANDQTRAAMQPVQQQGQLAAAQIGQQTQQLAGQEQGARADLQLRQQQLQQSNSIRKQQLLQDLGNSRSTLDLDKDRAKLEQLATTMRLSDKKYMDTLESEGQRKRLDNDLSFKDELQNSLLGSNADLLKQQLGNKSVLAVDEREFTKALASIDIGAALQMAANEAKDARTAATIQGVGGLATGGIGAAGTKWNSAPPTEAEPQPANMGTTQAHGGPEFKSGY